MKKNTITLFIALVAVATIGAFVINGMSNSENEKVAGVETENFTVHHTPTCGCCDNYVTYLKRKRYEIDSVVNNDISDIKKKYGVPMHLASCHTSVVDGYVVEGHIPIEVIEKLLTEKPDIAGIALAEMPSGSPGMPGRKLEPFQIHIVSHDGSDGGLFMEF